MDKLTKLKQHYEATEAQKQSAIEAENRYFSFRESRDKYLNRLTTAELKAILKSLWPSFTHGKEGSYFRGKPFIAKPWGAVPALEVYEPTLKDMYVAAVHKAISQEKL